MDKPTLKNNALSAMRACIAHEWSAFNLNVQQQRCEGAGRDFYKDAKELTIIEQDHQMRQCFNFLKEYYENG